MGRETRRDRAEREEYEWLFKHQARGLQDRLVRRGHTDRTWHHAIPEWEKIYPTEVQQRKLMHQARALRWGKEKIYYSMHKRSIRICLDE